MRLKKLETRALPPKVEEMNNYIQEMESIAAKVKAETRALTPDEVNRVTELRCKIDMIKAELTAEEEQRQSQFTKEINLGDLNIIKPGEKLFKNEYRNANTLKLGDIVKAMAGANASKDAIKYVRSMNSTTGAVAIPKELSAIIFDIARQHSSLFGRVPVIPMDANNLTIAKVAKDAEAHFVEEGDLIPASETLFEGIELKGKTMAIYVPVTEQLLSSANISDLLMSACSKAIAAAMDKALLYGDGTGANIKGLSEHSNIHKVDYNGNGEVHYNMLLEGVKAIKKGNIEPDSIVFNTDTSIDLAMKVDSDGNYLQAPKILARYDVFESNNIDDKQALVYNSDSLLVGINEGMTIEWGYSSDGFQRMVKSLRIYMRMDLGVINEQGIALVTAV